MRTKIESKTRVGGNKSEMQRTDRQGRIALDGSPKTDRPGRIAQDGSPRTDHQGRIAKNESSRSDRPGRIAKDGSPRTDRQGRIAQDGSPRTDHPGRITQDGSPSVLYDLNFKVSLKCPHSLPRAISSSVGAAATFFTPVLSPHEF